MSEGSHILDGQWLGDASERSRFRAMATAGLAELKAVPPGTRVLLVESDALACAAALALVFACDLPVRLFLGSPHWGSAQQEAVANGVAPERIWGRLDSRHGGAYLETPDPCGQAEIFIPTGGTTGGSRFARHTRSTLQAAAVGLACWLGVGPIHSICFLPLFHVSGLMQLVRAWVTAGTVQFASWRTLQDGAFPALRARGGAAVTSLVPTQLARLVRLPEGVAWLRQLDAVFLGGAAPWRDLLAAARESRVPLAPCYGMTETAAQVASMRPADFLAGQEVAAEVLPHAGVEIVAGEGNVVAESGREGLIRVRGASLFHGYWPDPDAARDAWLTADRGRWDASGRLQVLGRMDGVINSGGEKIDPAPVEEAIRRTGCVEDVAVCGVAHSEWGEEVVAVLSGCAAEDEARIIAALRRELSAHQVPKRLLRVREIPRTPAGKIDRPALTRLCRPGDWTT